MLKPATLVAFVVFSMAPVARAADVYVLDMAARAQRLPDSCTALFWDADTLFYNTGNSMATVSLIGISNGLGNSDRSQPAAATIPGGSILSLRANTRWWEGADAGLWLYHLNVPDGVVVDGEMLPSRDTSFCPGAPRTLQSFGKERLPVFRSLVPSGSKQSIRGLTLGDLPAHINVGIYNAGPVSANATIELRRACDNAVVETRLVNVAADSVQQFTGFQVPSSSACALATDFGGVSGLNGLGYVSVTVDQPSLTFASVVSTADVPVSSIANVPISTVQVEPGTVP